MATKKTHAQKHKNGTTIYFKGYDAAGNGDLKVGDELKITGFDKAEDLYNVKRVKDGKVDSLFDVEFSLKPVKAEAKVEAKVEAKAETKAPAKKAAAKAPAKKEEVKAPAKAEAKAKVEAKTEEKTEEEVQEFVSTASVTAVVSEHKGNYLKSAKSLAEAKERTIFTLGGVLANIKRNDLFLSIKGADGEPAYDAGNNGFNAYVKVELGIESRSAAYYVDLYEMFSQVTTEAKIAKIGWTKLRELLPLKNIIDEKNVDQWLTKAKEQPAETLHESVTKALVKAGEPVHGNRGGGLTADQVKLIYVVHNDQKTIVDNAIEKAKDIMGDGTSDSAALVHILTEWLDSKGSE